MTGVQTCALPICIAAAHWALGRTGGLVLARAADPGLDDVEPLIDDALRAAEAEGIHGQEITPFVLAFLHERSDGRTLEVNRLLAADNAALAAEVATALTTQ